MLKINISEISTKPGVYIFTGENERILYVGKAKSLRNRLGSYFNNTSKSLKTTRMLSVAKNVKTIVTETEVEAFLLESNLIKTEQPKYNILLKDSKGYPYVKLTKEPYPRLLFTRNTDDVKSEYFGPFVASGELRHLLVYLRNSFPLRTCTNTQFNKGKICLKYQIKKCPGPCEGLISDEDYQKIVSDVRTFFQGDVTELTKKLTDQMIEYSEKLKFEEAAFYRDRLKSLEQLFSKQTVVQVNKKEDTDLFYKHELHNIIGITQLFIRGGRVIGAKSHFFPDVVSDEDNTDDDLLERFIMQFYANVRQFPKTFIAEGGVVSEALSQALSKMAGRAVVMRRRGYGDLLELAKKNSENATLEYINKTTATADILKRLANIVNSDTVSRIECLDISHLGGDNTVGVSVVSVDTKFNKNDYRKYKIRTAENDDVKSMSEVISRKVVNILDESEKKADLYIIDGGISQLNATVKTFKDGGLDVNCISISKSRSMRGMKHEGAESIEEIHLFGRKNPLKFRKNDPLLLFIQKMRDEAHRFAIKYSRQLSLKSAHTSPMLKIPGMGIKRLTKLLMKFPDIYAHENLTVAELDILPKDLAEKVIEYIENERKLR